ncbi:MAG: outer membrane protein assembly factor BamA [Treponemataceae bacterium]
MFAFERKKVFLFLLLICMSFFAFSQSEGEWWDKKTIRNITFDGLKSIKSFDLDGVTRPFVGKPFSDDLYTNLLNRIFSLDYFEDIVPEVFPIDSEKNAILIRFTVKEKPTILKINYEGNRSIKISELKNAVTIKEKDIFNESSLRAEERAIRDVYLQKGFTSIKVSSSFKKVEEGINVSFHVNEGTSTVLKAINFEGNELVSSKTLKKTMKLKEAGLINKGAFQESMLEADKQEILNYYLNRGYIDALIVDVNRTITQNLQKGHEELTITFVVREGVQYTFGGITFSGNEIFSTQILNSKVRLKPGDIYNHTRLQEGLMAVADVYFENGYTSNSIDPVQNRDVENRKVSYAVGIIERPRSHIENIRVEGNAKTKPHVILREINLEGGDIFSKTKLVNGLRNLYNLQFFSAVIPDVVPGSEENLVDLIITVEEQSTTSVEFGLTFSGLDDPQSFPISAFVKWQDSNFLGTGKTLSTSLTASPDQQEFSIGYADYWLFGIPMSVSTSLDFSHSSLTDLQNVYFPGGVVTDDYYMTYQQWDITLNGAIGRRWFPHFAILSWQSGIGISFIRNIYDDEIYTPNDTTISDYAHSWGVTNTLWTSASLDGRDINYDPSNGWFVSQRIAWTGFIPQVENQFYFRSDTKLELYAKLLDVKVTENWNLKFVLAGYAGLSFQIPTENSFVGSSNQLYIDGMFNGRGWNSVYNLRGMGLFSSYLELRWPIIPGIVALDFFVDAVALKPTVKSLFSSLKLDDFYFSFGPGVRFSMPQFPLRLLLANTFQVKNNVVHWRNGTGPDWQFVLSFNLINK